MTKRNKFLGPTETKIMRVLWDATAPMTMQELSDALSIHYSTVYTLTQRLVTKKLVIRQESELKYFHYAYVPVHQSEQEFIRATLAEYGITVQD